MRARDGLRTALLLACGVTVAALLAAVLYLLEPDRVRFALFQARSRATIAVLSLRHPGLRYYFQARDQRPIEATYVRALTFAPGRHTSFGKPFFVDEHGFSYRDEALFHTLERKPFARRYLVLGGSVAFGLSPFETGSFVDRLNEMQDDIRFYNRAFPGASCVASEPILRDALANGGVTFDGILLYEAVNYVPYLCNPQTLAQSRTYEGVARYFSLVQENLAKIRGYDGAEFRDCNRKLLEVSGALGIPFVIVKFVLAYDEAMQDRPLYDLMVNGQCNAEYQLRMVRVHNQVFDELQAGAHPGGVYVLDPTPALFGKPEFFWDACHLNRLGNETMARVVADGLVAAGLMRR